MKRGRTFTWIPLWVDKWLWGSTRHELAHDERAVFIDLLALASKDDGYIRANPVTPYPLDQLAGMLYAPKELLERTIQHSKDFGKIEESSKGIFHISSWEGYQLSDRRKRDLNQGELVISEKTEMGSKKADPIPIHNTETNTDTNIKKDSRESSAPRRKNIVSKLPSIIFNFESQSWENITEEDKAFFQKAYPACEIDQELLKMAAWLLANPNQRKVRYRRFITNWLSRAQDRGGTKSGGWQILNYAKYRKFSYSDSKEAIKKRKQREKKGGHKGDAGGHVPFVPGHSASASASESLNLNKDIEEIKRGWNEFAAKNNLATIIEIEPDSERGRHLVARMAEKDWDFPKLLEAIGQSPFLLGKKGKEPFFVTFDWLLWPGNYQRTMEGNYKDRQQPNEARPALGTWLKTRQEKK